MRMIVHFGETLPEKITPEHIIGSGLLFIWALCIFCGMLFCFGIGAATGQPSNADMQIYQCTNDMFCCCMRLTQCTFAMLNELTGVHDLICHCPRPVLLVHSRMLTFHLAYNVTQAVSCVMQHANS